MRRALVVVVGVVSTASFFACKARKGGSELLTNSTNPNETALDVNDLSYLLPLNAAGQIYPEIRVAASWNQIRLLNDLPGFDDGGTNPILTKAVYDSIVAATADQTNFGARETSIKTPFKAGDTKDFEHDAFVITSFRIDPCAPSLALDKNRTNYQNPVSQAVIGGIVQQLNQEIADIFGQNKFTLSNCQTQLRLILQPVAADRKTIKESTIHMVYTLNAGAGIMNDTLQADVQGLKKALQDATTVDTTGYMLQPHPGLAAEGAANQDSSKGGPGAKAVIEYLSNVLHKFNNSQVMAVIRETVVNGVQYDVVLGGGVSDPRETATYAAGPLVASTAKKGFIITSNADRRTWRMEPAPTRNSPVFQNLITFDPSSIDNPNDSVLLNMMKKDDPESTHFFVNDCVTCHGTSQAFKELGDMTLASTSINRYRVPPGVSGFPIGTFLPPAPGGSGANVVGVLLRNFGYSRGQPVIGLRTVTETAALADYFNRDLRRIANPGASCNGPAEEKAWVAAINLGKGDGGYKYVKGSGAKEDELFNAAGCETKVATAALGERGDGQNTPKTGNAVSPIFSRMSFEGNSAAGGQVSLSLAKMGLAATAQVVDGTPEQSIGKWEYSADANRTSQIKVTMDDGTFFMTMNGQTLCEVVPEGGQARFKDCLALQTPWARASRVNVELYAGSGCSGASAKIGPTTDCGSLKGSYSYAKLGNVGCVTIYPVPTSAAEACSRLKAAGGSTSVTFFQSETCDPKMFVGGADTLSSCQAWANPLDSNGYAQGKRVGTKACEVVSAEYLKTYCGKQFSGK